jgi:hypothetical protein
MSLSRALVTDVPGDGTCLFHAIAFSFQNPLLSGENLRDIVANFIERHPHALLHGVSIETWIQWESHCSAMLYAKKLRNGMWGGALEMTILASLLDVNIFVYELDSESRTTKPICSRVTDVLSDPTFLLLFQKEQPRTTQTKRKKICLLWVNKCHYMHLHLQLNK